MSKLFSLIVFLDSTQSSDSMTAAAVNDFHSDRNSMLDSVSVGSDNSDSDSVFGGRSVKKKHTGRMAANSMKILDKSKIGKLV